MQQNSGRGNGPDGAIQSKANSEPAADKAIKCAIHIKLDGMINSAQYLLVFNQSYHHDYEFVTSGTYEFLLDDHKLESCRSSLSLRLVIIVHDLKDKHYIFKHI